MAKYKPLNNGNLFIDSNRPEWEFELPDLEDVDVISLDCETDGLRIFGEHKPVGFAITVYEDMRSWYIPFGHRRGFNFEQENVIAWAKDNLRNKHVENHNIKFDIQMLRKIGIDLEELNCTVGDVALDAALLNSKRQSYKLEDLAQQVLGKGKINLPGNIPIHERYSEEVASYAIRDTELVVELDNKFTKSIYNENLQTVRELEYELIYPVCHMEGNGVHINVPLLEQWQRMAQERMTRIFWELYRQSGMRVEPTKEQSVHKLCNSLGIKVNYTDNGGMSLTNEWLVKQHHPLMQLIFEYRKLNDLKSDFLDKYLVSLDSQNKLRYNLNQLKSDEYGTVTGRFSASGSKNPEDDKKINPQQVIKVDDEDVEDNIIQDMPIRELFIPEPGKKWISADASQLQFRIFAHYSEDERLIGEYRQNPNADFHKLVAEKILGGRLPRSQAKHENFGNLFGMGVEKGARRLGVTVDEYKKIKEVYHSNFPAAKRLSYKAQGLAMHPKMGPHKYTNKIGRGYVMTISKRRRRYDPNENLNSAINAVIQGTEADIVKDSLIKVYKERKHIDYNIYFTVHDSIDGGTPEDRTEKSKKDLEEILNDHSSWEKRFNIKFEVPILWDVKSGDNWNL